MYPKQYETVPAAIGSLREYFRFYNEERLHQALGYQPPAALYYRPPRRKVKLAAEQRHE